jgi:hypothetical protein
MKVLATVATAATRSHDPLAQAPRIRSSLLGLLFPATGTGHLRQGGEHATRIPAATGLRSLDAAGCFWKLHQSRCRSISCGAKCDSSEDYISKRIDATLLCTAGPFLVLHEVRSCMHCGACQTPDGSAIGVTFASSVAIVTHHLAYLDS